MTGGGRTRLAPVFVEWLMGLDKGWVTAPELGLTEAEQLHALGNGVVPRQAVAALTALTRTGPVQDPAASCGGPAGLGWRV